MPPIPTFTQYLDSLGPLTIHSDPTIATAESTMIKTAAASLAALPEVTSAALAQWAAEHAESVNVLGLAVGLSQEKLKNFLKHTLNTAGWVKLARERPGELVAELDREFDLVRLISSQRIATYDFGDILVARAGTRQTAAAAGASGRKVEDEIEAIARTMGLPYQTRTRFTGRDHRTAPCDLVIPAGRTAEIVVAAKGFDSTGSKRWPTCARPASSSWSSPTASDGRTGSTTSAASTRSGNEIRSTACTPCQPSPDSVPTCKKQPGSAGCCQPGEEGEPSRPVVG